MNKLLLSSLAAALLCADDTEIQSLKAQMAQMEAMMKAMQEKINHLEHQRPVQTADVDEIHHDNAHSAHNLPKAVSDFDLSLVLDTSYVSRSQKDEQLAHLELPGIAHGLFAPHNHNGSSHPTYNAQNGFNLNYAEMGIHSELTSNLDAEVLLHFSEGGVDIEEAFFTAHDLPYNLRLKGGKFLSDFGYLNNRHHHEWSFSDMPLVYEAFLGNHGIDEIGAQLQWTAPTDTYLMLGIEALQGKNEGMFAQAAINNPYAGQEEEVLSGSAQQPSLYLGYVKTSADIGDSTILAGASWAHGNTRINHFSDETPYAISAKSNLYGLDLTLHYRIHPHSALVWQSEWLYRDMKGTYIADSDNDVSTVNELVYSPIHKKQAGYYTQLVYTPSEEWGIGARYDAIYRNHITGTDQFAPENMDQFSAMVEHRSGETARYRLQYTHSNAFFNEAQERQNLDSLIFSVNLLLGSHSDHED